MWSLYPCPTTWFEPYIMILKSRANQTRKRTRVDRLNKILKEEKKIHMKQLQRKKCRWTLVLGTTWKWISNWHWHRFECVALKVLCLVSSQFCQKKKSLHTHDHYYCTHNVPGYHYHHMSSELWRGKYN